ncbi:MAG: cytochrome P450 [Dehalococcoidia bacterium]
MTATTSDHLDGINLSDPEAFRRNEAHAMFRVLRAQDRLHWDEGTSWFPGFWSIVTYDDVLTVSRDPTTFISSKGINMMTDPVNPSTASGLGKMLITMDPPRHVRLRRLVNKGFTPRAVSVIEPHIRAITTSIIDDIAAPSRCEFVSDVAALLPLAVICEMMGVAKDDRKLMFELTNRVLGADDPEYQTAGGDDGDARRATAEQGQREMFGYFMRLLGERRADRRDDLVSVLAGADVDGDQLTDEEILFFSYLLILAGNETTRNAISGGLLALFEHPEQMHRLQANPTLMPLAVEEILRWTSPVMHMTRVATRDVRLHDTDIRAGERVCLWYPSANRDEAVFADPDTFDIARDPNDHLAFGIGEHFCLGAGFARLELKVMFEELLRRLPDIAPDGESERLRSTFIGGIKHMPVRYTARP